MRLKRAKTTRRTLQFFAQHAGYNPPFHVLLDATFLYGLVRHKLPLLDRLEKILQHERFMLYTTRSAIDELSQLEQAAAKENKGYFVQAREWAQQNCTEILSTGNIENGRNTKKAAVAGNKVEKLSQVAKHVYHLAVTLPRQQAKEQELQKKAKDKEHNKDLKESSDAKVTNDATTLDHQSFNVNHRDLVSSDERALPPRLYIVATNDNDLLNALRISGNVPILRLAQGCILSLEQPSSQALQHAKQQEHIKWGTVPQPERQLAQLVKEEQKKEAASNDTPVRRKHKAKAPNPLSCKRKKESTEKRKKTRKRKKTST